MKKKSNQIATTKHISKDDVLALLAGNSLTSIEICQHFATVSPLEIQNHLSALVFDGFVSRCDNGLFSVVKDCPQMVKDCPQMVKDCPQVDMVQVALSEALKPIPTAQIALKCGLPMTIVSKYKGAKRAVSLEKAIIICAKLGLTREFLAMFEIEVAKVHYSITGEVLK